MNVVIIDGIMGAGKTLGMTLLTQYFSYKSGCAHYNNYGAYGSLPFLSYRDFLLVAGESSSIIALDESHTDLDARNFNTNAVKFFTHLVFYFRKLRTTMFLATPTIDTLDNRVRTVCQIYIRCSKDKRCFYYDLYDYQSGRRLKRFRIEREKAYAIASQLYDTYNIVTPIEWPSERVEFHNFLAELKEKTFAYYDNLRLQSRSVGAGLRPAAEADAPVLVSPHNPVLEEIAV